MYRSRICRTMWNLFKSYSRHDMMCTRGVWHTRFYISHMFRIRYVDVTYIMSDMFETSYHDRTHPTWCHHKMSPTYPMWNLSKSPSRHDMMCTRGIWHPIRHIRHDDIVSCLEHMRYDVTISARPYESCKNIEGLGPRRCLFETGTTVVQIISTWPAWSGENEKNN